MKKLMYTLALGVVLLQSVTMPALAASIPDGGEPKFPVCCSEPLPTPNYPWYCSMFWYNMCQ